MMDLFISWSGERSRAAAKAFREWLQLLLQNVNPWMSEIDIRAGDRWNREVEEWLEKSNFGIVVLTRDNLKAPWLLFEAGALAKSVDKSSLAPYLIDLTPSQLTGPLAPFQGKEANESGTWEIVKSINSAMKDKGRPLSQLEKLFEKFWPELELALTKLPEETKEIEPRRTTDDMVEEILLMVRDLIHRLDSRSEQEQRVIIPPIPPWFERLLDGDGPEQETDRLEKRPRKLPLAGSPK